MSQNPNINWLERLGKWRAALTGRLLGTRLITDPQCRAFRDLFDKVNILKAESRVFQHALTTKDVATADEFSAAFLPTHPAQTKGIHDLFGDLLILRAEVSALQYLLMQKGIINEAEFGQLIQEECKWLCERYEQQFPGFKATDAGLSINTSVAAKTVEGWPI
jgi:hypothetical protein